MSKNIQDRAEDHTVTFEVDISTGMPIESKVITEPIIQESVIQKIQHELMLEAQTTAEQEFPFAA